MCSSRKETLLKIAPRIYFTVLSEFSGIFSFFVGATVLLGWALDIAPLKMLLPGFVTMKANTALCFALAGCSLFLLQTKRLSGTTRFIARACCCCVIGIAALTLYEYSRGVNLGIDELLFKDDADAVLTSHAGRMAISSAVNFILICGGLLAFDAGGRRGHVPAQLCAVTSWAGAALSLVGYLYGIKFLYFGVHGVTAMAVPTAAAFFVLSVGTLFARTDGGLAALIAGDTTAGVVVRSLLPIAFVVPPLFGWLQLCAQRAGLISSELGLSIVAVGNMAVAVGYILWLGWFISRADDRLKEMQLQLIQSAKLESVGRLAAGVAHEVKNPLAIIMQGLYFIRHADVSKKADIEATLGELDHAVGRADRVIRGLLDFSAAQELSPEPLSINAVVESSLHLIRHELVKYQVVVEKNLDAALPMLHLDRQKMEQVFVNILVNACHAMPAGGVLRLSTRSEQASRKGGQVGERHTDLIRTEDPTVVVEVRDSGPGIPDANLSKIFDPFFTTKETGKGTGLGLSVVKTIVEMHGGIIRIQNQAQGGACVAIQLPVAAAPARKASSGNAA